MKKKSHLYFFHVCNKRKTPPIFHFSLDKLKNIPIYKFIWNYTSIRNSRVCILCKLDMCKDPIHFPILRNFTTAIQEVTIFRRYFITDSKKLQYMTCFFGRCKIEA